MLHALMDWLDIIARWIINNPGYCILGLVAIGIIQTVLGKIWPCLFGHAEEAVTRVFHESDNVRCSTIDFYCKRCGKKL